MRPKRPTREELNQIEVRAARVAIEAFMLTLREGIKPYGPEGETGAVLDFFGGTEHRHAGVIMGTRPGTLTFTFRLDPKPEAPERGRPFELPMQCKVGPVLQALMMKDCPNHAVVVCFDAADNTWVACGQPEHQKGAVKTEPLAAWLEREGWLGGAGPAR